MHILCQPIQYRWAQVVFYFFLSFSLYLPFLSRDHLTIIVYVSDGCLMFCWISSSGLWDCSDSFFLKSFSEHDPVMVLFLSVYPYGTIITYPYIHTERLLLIRILPTNKDNYTKNPILTALRRLPDRC